MNINGLLLRRRFETWAVIALFLAGLAGCEQKMADQPRYDPLEPSRLFSDGMSARPVIAGTVARGELPSDSPDLTGMVESIAEPPEGPPSLDRSADYLNEFPLPVTAALVAGGRLRYGIYCAPCHGADGTGTGPVVEFGYPKAQSFRTDRLRQAPVGYLFDVVTRGYQDMPAFGNRIDSRDRWAIIAYIRAAQLSGEEQWDGSLASFAEQLPVMDSAAPIDQGRGRLVPTDAGSGRFVIAERPSEEPIEKNTNGVE